MTKDEAMPIVERLITANYSVKEIGDMLRNDGEQNGHLIARTCYNDIMRRSAVEQSDRIKAARQAIHQRLQRLEAELWECYQRSDTPVVLQEGIPDGHGGITTTLLRRRERKGVKNYKILEQIARNLERDAKLLGILNEYPDVTADSKAVQAILEAWGNLQDEE